MIKNLQCYFPQKISTLLSLIIGVLGKEWDFRKPGGNSGKFSQCKVVLLGAVISTPKF